MQKNGFTLVELSIVLVIIGLLIGGILGGQELIRTSELNSVTRDIDQFRVSVNAFKLKYNALPGDMVNASSYWPTCSGTPANCNGNGNNVVASNQSTWSETWRFWQQLSAAGIVPGSFSGVAASCGALCSRGGDNVPFSKVSGGVYWSFGMSTSYTGHLYYFDGAYSNLQFWFGAETADAPSGALLSGVDTQYIDTKMDDGKPGMGKARTLKGSYMANCNSSDVAATSAYNLTAGTKACMLMIDY